MTIESGGVGVGRVGAMLVGYKMFGVPCSGNFITDTLTNAVNQSGSAHGGQPVSATVLINGVDQTSLLESLKVKNSTLEGASFAELTFIGGAVSGLVLRQSTVEIFFNYEIGGDVFTAKIFTGTARKLTSNPAETGETQQIQLYDDSKILSEYPPSTTVLFGLPTHYTGSALNLIRAELAALGIYAVESTMVDYTIGGTPPIGELSVSPIPNVGWGSVQEMVNAVVSGRSPGYSRMGSDGIFRLYDSSVQPDAEWDVPTSTQFSCKKLEPSSGVYNRVTVTGAAGGSTTYNNTVHQAINGILETSVTAYFCNGTASQTAFGLAYSTFSLRNVYELEISVIPFIGAGSAITFDYQAGSVSAMVESSEITFSWPGGPTHKITCREF